MGFLSNPPLHIFTSKLIDKETLNLEHYVKLLLG